jgi:hypothetical protein
MDCGAEHAFVRMLQIAFFCTPLIYHVTRLCTRTLNGPSMNRYKPSEILARESVEPILIPANIV